MRKVRSLRRKANCEVCDVPIGARSTNDRELLFPQLCDSCNKAVFQKHIDARNWLDSIAEICMDDNDYEALTLVYLLLCAMECLTASDLRRLIWNWLPETNDELSDHPERNNRDTEFLPTFIRFLLLQDEMILDT